MSWHHLLAGHIGQIVDDVVAQLLAASVIAEPVQSSQQAGTGRHLLLALLGNPKVIVVDGEQQIPQRRPLPGESRHPLLLLFLLLLLLLLVLLRIGSVDTWLSFPRILTHYHVGWPALTNWSP